MIGLLCCLVSSDLASVAVGEARRNNSFRLGVDARDLERSGVDAVDGMRPRFNCGPGKDTQPERYASHVHGLALLGPFRPTRELKSRTV